MRLIHQMSVCDGPGEYYKCRGDFDLLKPRLEETAINDISARAGLSRTERAEFSKYKTGFYYDAATIEQKPLFEDVNGDGYRDLVRYFYYHAPFMISRNAESSAGRIYALKRLFKNLESVGDPTDRDRMWLRASVEIFSDMQEYFKLDDYGFDGFHSNLILSSDTALKNFLNFILREAKEYRAEEEKQGFTPPIIQTLSEGLLLEQMHISNFNFLSYQPVYYSVVDSASGSYLTGDCALPEYAGIREKGTFQVLDLLSYSESGDVGVPTLGVSPSYRGIAMVVNFGRPEGEEWKFWTNPVYYMFPDAGDMIIYPGYDNVTLPSKLPSGEFFSVSLGRGRENVLRIRSVDHRGLFNRTLSEFDELYENIVVRPKLIKEVQLTQEMLSAPSHPLVLGVTLLGDNETLEISYTVRLESGESSYRNYTKRIKLKKLLKG